MKRTVTSGGGERLGPGSERRLTVPCSGMYARSLSPQEELLEETDLREDGVETIWTKYVQTQRRLLDKPVRFLQADAESLLQCPRQTWCY